MSYNEIPVSVTCNEDCDEPFKENPLYFVRPFKEMKSTWKWFKILSQEFRWLGKQHEAQKLFSLIAVNLAGTVTLLIWCRLTSSLALLAYTYLSWFNFLSLLTWLLCVWVKAQKASFTYTFGLVRCEVLAVFTSVTLTLLGALFILKESVERLIQPEDIKVDHLSCMAFIGFILNVVMTTMIQNPPLTHILRCSSSSVLQEHFADMCHSLCFQMPGLKRFLLPRMNPLILISFVGFIFIVANHIVVHIYNYPRSDTIAAFLIATFTICTMYPLCICSSNLLLQTIPLHYSSHLDKCLREALTLDGVLEFRNEKFWVLGVGFESEAREKLSPRTVPRVWSGSVVAGSLHVRVRRDANEQMVLKHITDRLKLLVPILTVQVFKDEWTRNVATLRLLKDCVGSNGEPRPISSPFHPLTNSYRATKLPLQSSPISGEANLNHDTSILSIDRNSLLPDVNVKGSSLVEHGVGNHSFADEKCGASDSSPQSSHYHRGRQQNNREAVIVLPEW